MNHLPPSREALALLERALEEVPSGVSADVRFTAGRYLTMRYANSAIHEPHLESGWGLSVRVEDQKRLGTATTNDLTAPGIRDVVEEAGRMARVAPVERHFLGFSRSRGPAPRATAFSEATAHLSAEEVGRLARRALDSAQRAVPDGRISGVMNAGGSLLAVGNTRGLRRSARRSFVQATVLVDRPMLDPPPSGWAEGAHWDVRRFDPVRLGQEAAERIPKAPAMPMTPGTYRVLFLGPAASELMAFLGFLGFAGQAEVEGWSCLARLRGKPVFPRWFELRDDGRSPATLPRAVDFEGTPKRSTPLIVHGRASPAVTDLITAGRLGRRSTGHALPPEAPWGSYGPLPGNLVVAPGSATLDELLAEVGTGLLVTRLHYVRVVHPGRGEITGMTRDGTYRIEGGRLGAPVRNLRFTDSVVGATERLLAGGREVRCYADERGTSSTSCPALAVGGFRFTSTTLF